MHISKGGEVAVAANTRAFNLTVFHQILLGCGIVLTLIASLFLTNSLILVAAVLFAVVLFAVMRNGVSSLFAFIIINVVVSLRTKEEGANGAPSSLDLMLGIMLVSIIVYWVVRLQILERESLSHSVGQLLLLIFMVWSVGVTIVGLSNEHNSLNSGVREIINLSPLLILPLLYERFIEPGSKVESALFGLVLFSAALIIFANIWTLRNHLVRAYYLFQVGRSSYDLSLTMFIILIMTSILMHTRRWWQTLLAISFLLLGFAGLATTFSRNSYITTPLAMIVVFWLGNAKERLAGMKRLMYASFIGVALTIQICLSSRALRIILLRYGLQLLSAGHYHTDLSLLARYVEWRQEWQAILQSPILGHGFGTQFRNFDIILRLHTWMSFSHNSYLYLVFKTGFFGALLFLSAYFIFMGKGLKLAKSQSFTPRSRVALRASFAFLVIVLTQAYLGPVFDSKTSMIWVGLVWGYYLALEKQERKRNMDASMNGICSNDRIPQEVGSL